MAKIDPIKKIEWKDFYAKGIFKVFFYLVELEFSTPCCKIENPFSLTISYIQYSILMILAKSTQQIPFSELSALSLLSNEILTCSLIVKVITMLILVPNWWKACTWQWSYYW